MPSSRTWSSGTATCGRSTQVVVAEDDLDLGAGQVRAHSSLAYPHAALPVPLSIPLRSLPLAALPAFEDGTGRQQNG